jgi:uncharacterized protein involved in outer membrane biogenesis
VYVVKKVLIALGMLIIVLGAAILIVPGFIDWSGHRAEIAQKVEETTGRELIIGGNIAFTLIPSPVLKINDIHLANASGAQAQDMISVEQLDVRVALLPLLAGNIHVQSIRLIRPVIQLEVMGNGKGNWIMGKDGENDDDIPPPTQRAAPAFVATAPSPASALPIQSDNLIVEQGHLVYHDKAGNIHEEIHDLNSRFAIADLNGPFEVAGTMTVHGIPVGIEGSIGQIIHDRTATFAAQVKLAHGDTDTRISGTLVNLADGPKLSAKINLKGRSLAGLIGAFHGKETLAGGLNRAFSAQGEFNYGPNGFSLGPDGMALTIGEDRASLHVDYQNRQTKTLNVKANFNKIDGDAWLDAAPYQVQPPAPLPLVIKLSGKQAQQGSKVSAAIGKADTAQQTSTPSQPEPFRFPDDLEARLNLNVDAFMLKGEAIRQAQANISLTEGEIALERLSAILPGAGELSILGIAGDRDGHFQFDGSMDLNIAHLRGALQWAAIDAQNVPLSRLQQVTLKSEIALNATELRLFNLEAKLDGSTLRGAITAALQARPSFGATLSLDQLDLDAYQITAPAAPKQTEARNSTEGQNSPSSVNQNKKPAWLSALDILKTFDANLNLSARQIVYQKQSFDDLRLVGTVFDGLLKLEDMRLNLSGADLGGKGTLNPHENGLQTQDLTFALQGDNLAGAAQFAGLEKLIDWQKVGPTSAQITLNGPLLAPDIDINIDTLGTTVFAAAKADLLPMPKGEASLNINISDLKRLSHGLGLSYTPHGTPDKLDINADLTADLTHGALNNIVAHIGDGQLKGNMKFTQGPRPVLDVVLNADRLDITPFLPADTKTTGDTPPAGNPTSGAVKKTGEANNNRWSRQKIDFNVLNALDATIRFKSDTLLYKKITLEKLILAADLKNSSLLISQLDGKLFGGQAKITSQLVATEKASLQIKLSANDLDLKQALTESGARASTNGTATLEADLSTTGLSEYELISNLNGTSSLYLNKVNITDQKTGGSAFDLLKLLATLSGTDIGKGLADITAVSNIENGIAKLAQTDLNSNIATGNANGSVDLTQWIMDIDGTLKLKQNALMNALASKAKMKQTYPFSLQGPIDSPNVKLDSGSLNSGGGLIIPLPDKLEKKGYGTVIRSLLGGANKTENTSNETTTNVPSAEERLIKGLGNLLKQN